MKRKDMVDLLRRKLPEYVKEIAETQGEDTAIAVELNTLEFIDFVETSGDPNDEFIWPPVEE